MVGEDFIFAYRESRDTPSIDVNIDVYVFGFFFFDDGY